jgi:hypothetical protein
MIHPRNIFLALFLTVILEDYSANAKDLIHSTLSYSTKINGYSYPQRGFPPLKKML